MALAREARGDSQAEAIIDLVRIDNNVGKHSGKHWRGCHAVLLAACYVIQIFAAVWQCGTRP